jgi:hypothetical protein
MPNKSMNSHSNKGSSTNKGSHADQGSPSMNLRSRSQGAGKGNSSQGKGYSSQSKGMPMGNQTKKGCFPKLFVLLLPFVAAGAYLFLRPI